MHICQVGLRQVGITSASRIWDMYDMIRFCQWLDYIMCCIITHQVAMTLPLVRPRSFSSKAQIDGHLHYGSGGLDNCPDNCAELLSQCKINKTSTRLRPAVNCQSMYWYHWEILVQAEVTCIWLISLSVTQKRLVAGLRTRYYSILWGSFTNSPMWNITFLKLMKCSIHDSVCIHHYFQKLDLMHAHVHWVTRFNIAFFDLLGSKIHCNVKATSIQWQWVACTTTTWPRVLAHLQRVSKSQAQKMQAGSFETGWSAVWAGQQGSICLLAQLSEARQSPWQLATLQPTPSAVVLGIQETLWPSGCPFPLPRGSGPAPRWDICTQWAHHPRWGLSCLLSLEMPQGCRHWWHHGKFSAWCWGYSDTAHSHDFHPNAHWRCSSILVFRCTLVIHPVFKSGDVNDPNNCRGITLTSVLSKLFAMELESRMSKLGWRSRHESRRASWFSQRSSYHWQWFHHSLTHRRCQDKAQ